MLKWDRGTKWQEWEHYCNGQTLLTFISRGLYCSCLLKGSLTNFQAIIYGLPPSSLRPLSGCKYPIQVDWGQLATTVKSLICSSTSAAKGMLMWPEKVSLKKNKLNVTHGNEVKKGIVLNLCLWMSWSIGLVLWYTWRSTCQ